MSRVLLALAGRPTYLLHSGPCSDKPSESVVGTPRVVRRLALAAIGASEPVTFGGGLDRAKATGQSADGSPAGPWPGTIAIGRRSQRGPNRSLPR